jgi:hypothetical protein
LSRHGAARSGYIPDDASFGKETFEVLSSRLQPGCAESAIVNGLLSLIDSARGLRYGRALPEDPTPSWKGYSVGRWEGDTLIVDSIGFRDDLWLDLRGSPLTSAGRVRERITRPDFGHLHIEVTVDDPKAYTRPWTVRLQQQIVADTEIIDENCLENEKFMRRLRGTP